MDRPALKRKWIEDDGAPRRKSKREASFLPLDSILSQPFVNGNTNTKPRISPLSRRNNGLSLSIPDEIRFTIFQHQTNTPPDDDAGPPVSGVVNSAVESATTPTIFLPRAAPTPPKELEDILSFPIESPTKSQGEGGAIATAPPELIYNYSGIRDDQCRLLIIKPGTGDEEIKTKLLVLFDKQLGDKHKYEALSYHWGSDGSDRFAVLIEDSTTQKPPKSFLTNPFTRAKGFISPKRTTYKRLRVKPNLYAALKHLRNATRSIALWVDALCINQSDEVEKQVQVIKMAQVYRKAESVCIWLGQGDYKSQRAMEFIPKVIELQHDDDLLTEENLKEWKNLYELMTTMSWFSRRWVIQELALAKSATVHCGTKMIHWNDFRDAIGLYERNYDLIQKREELYEYKSYLFRGGTELPIARFRSNAANNLQRVQAKILVDISSNVFRRDPSGAFRSTQGLERLVSTLTGFDTADPRDTIYAVLNLAKETTLKAACGGLLDPLKPNYSLDLYQVYREFVRWVIGSSKSLDIICRHWALPEREGRMPLTPRLVKLPSWILINDSSPGKWDPIFRARRVVGTFVGLPGDQKLYNASGDHEPDVRFGEDIIENSSLRTLVAQNPSDPLFVHDL